MRFGMFDIAVRHGPYDQGDSAEQSQQFNAFEQVLRNFHAADSSQVGIDRSARGIVHSVSDKDVSASK